MSVDQNLLRRYRKSLVAVLLFIAYAIGLFVHKLSVQQRLEQNLLDAASLELAATLAGQLDEFILELETHSAEPGQKTAAQLQSTP